MTIEGNLALSAVGETSQLVARASYSDGSTVDITVAVWTANSPGTIAVSATGVVTAVNLGAGYVFARYQNMIGAAFITATPPGTFVIAGRVREPGQSGLSGTTVLELLSGRSTVTDENGNFTMANMTANRLRISRDGYEGIEREARPGEFDDFPMQQMVRIQVGGSATPHPLSPNDLIYDVAPGQPCNPCRMIRVDVPSSGTLHVKLSWTAVQTISLVLWAGGQSYVRPANATVSFLEADLPVSGGQLLAYVEGKSLPSSVHVPFTFATSFNP